jgi:hypothetical protein
MSTSAATIFFTKWRSEYELQHAAELRAFQSIKTYSDLQVCELLRWFIQRKVEVMVSQGVTQGGGAGAQA